jgi:non-ribosomal peptide synthetase component F
MDRMQNAGALYNRPEALRLSGAQERLQDLAGVRQLLAGGDVLPVDAVARVRARFPAPRLVNGYGPTENATFTCRYGCAAR